MRIYRTLLGITTVAGLWFGAGMIHADDTAAATDADRRAKREAWCKENPEQCEAWKQKRAERKQRRAELQAKCAADPEKCDEMKQQMREHWKARKAAGGAPPAYKPKTPPPVE